MKNYVLQSVRQIRMANDPEINSVTQAQERGLLLQLAYASLK